MAQSPSKRRKITQVTDVEDNQEEQEDHGVALLCERPINRISTATVAASPKLPAVVESTAYLRPHPDCDTHDKEKARWSEDLDDTCCLKPPQAHHSGDSDLFFRLRIKGDPVATLKRWLGGQNKNLIGVHYPRVMTLRYLLTGQGDSSVSDQYRPEHLRVAIEYARIEAALCREHIEGMREYLTRAPYRHWYSNGGPAENVMHPSHFPTEGSTAQMNMEDLEEWLCRVGFELDYLRDWEAGMWQEILYQKWWEAKLGNLNEIQELLRLGFVDKNMVGEYCGVPDV